MNQSYSPVVVEVAELVDQTLIILQRPANVILQDVVRGGRDSTLSGGLRHEEELGNVGIHDGMVHNGARHGIVEFAVGLEEASHDALVDAHESDLAGGLGLAGTMLELLQFGLNSELVLTLRDAITDHKNASGVLVVALVVGAKGGCGKMDKSVAAIINGIK